jgi:hypothetical protein
LAQSIDTRTGGALGFAFAWGPGGSPTYGQTFRAPLTGNFAVASVEFQVQQFNGPHAGATPFLVAVYAWNGTAAFGSPVAQSPLSTTPAGSANAMTPVSAGLTGSALAPGGQYVALLTIAGTNPQGSNQFLFAVRTTDTYADGELVFGQTTDLLAPYGTTPSVDADMLLTFIAIPIVANNFVPDAANTFLGLQSNAGAVGSVLSQRAAATTFALDYDCSVFDEYGLCVTVGARNSQIGSDYADSGETAGLLTLAYRVTPEFRLGGFIDQNLVSQSPVGVDPKNTQPMLGAFAVYQENQDFSGLTVRGALAYQEGDLRITRPQLDNTEAGTGRTRTSAVAFGGEIAYGFPIDSTWVAQPYAGVRRSDSQRQGYVETTSSSVQFPITYNDFGQQVTSGTAGLRLRGAITPEFSLTFGAGMEYDLNSKMDRYTGTSTSTLAAFSINASQEQNELRAVGSAGMRYMVASNQALGFDASVRQLPYGNDPSITTMLRYSIGF